MTNIFKSIDIADNQRVFTDNQRNALAFDAINQYIAMYNEDVQKALGAFVDGRTELRQERFLNPMSGVAPESGFDPKAKPELIQAKGYWDVAYPLQSHDEGVGGSRVGMAYMTAEELSRHIEGVVSRNLGRRRYDLLSLMLTGTNTTFTDNIGSLTIRKLANADGTTYPPILGTSSDTSSHTHYLASGYVAGSISDTNNPLVTMRDHLVEHWGRSNSGYDIVVFCNKAQTVDSQLGGLTGIAEVPEMNKMYGDDTDLGNVMGNLPGGAFGAGYGVYVQNWDWIPSGYMLAVHLGAGVPRVAKERVDPSDTGLSAGLQLVQEQEEYPFTNMYWDDRFGYGTYNRLGAVALQLTASTWSDPTLAL